MKETNKDFNLPYFIISKLIEYLTLEECNEQKENKKSLIHTLLKIRVACDELTIEQYRFLIEKYFN